MVEKRIFQIEGFSSRPPPSPHFGIIFVFFRVLGRLSIVLEFLRVFAKSTGELLPKKKEKSYPLAFKKIKFILPHPLVKEEFQSSTFLGI